MKSYDEKFGKLYSNYRFNVDTYCRENFPLDNNINISASYKKMNGDKDYYCLMKQEQFREQWAETYRACGFDRYREIPFEKFTKDRYDIENNKWFRGIHSNRGCVVRMQFYCYSRNRFITTYFIYSYDTPMCMIAKDFMRNGSDMIIVNRDLFNCSVTTWKHLRYFTCLTKPMMSILFDTRVPKYSEHCVRYWERSENKCDYKR